MQRYARSAPALRMPPFSFRDSIRTLATLAGTAAVSGILICIIGPPELLGWVVAAPRFMLPWAGGLAGLWLCYACTGREE
jgi:hypothetical protein